MSATVAQERNCTLLIFNRDTSNFPSYDELQARMESGDPQDKIDAVQTAILMIMAGERMPRLLMSVIRFCINTRDKTLKKLLMVFWEIVEKYKPEGGLKDEMILVARSSPDLRLS